MTIFLTLTTFVTQFALAELLADELPLPEALAELDALELALEDAPVLLADEATQTSEPELLLLLFEPEPLFDPVLALAELDALELEEALEEELPFPDELEFELELELEEELALADAPALPLLFPLLLLPKRIGN